MAKRPTNSEAATLELYRVALENAGTQPEISTEMADLGYDAAKIAEGKALWAQTRAAYDANTTEFDESLAVYALFSSKREEIEKVFKMHCKKARVVFRKDSLTRDKLSISGEIPRTYVKWYETAKKFYEISSTNADIQSKLARLAITPEQFTAAKTLLTELETTRAEYLKEKGESQEATKIKDAAFAKMDDWMSEFYAVARIALEDKPQLLEALGKVVKG
ncbi:MAG: hypothetical protein EOM76_11000 [Sphingobacteriia bacterium]|nr:hypothetical protein [Sphingobacteriia bacterium]